MQTAVGWNGTTFQERPLRISPATKSQNKSEAQSNENGNNKQKSLKPQKEETKPTSQNQNFFEGKHASKGTQSSKFSKQTPYARKKI